MNYLKPIAIHFDIKNEDGDYKQYTIYDIEYVLCQVNGILMITTDGNKSYQYKTSLSRFLEIASFTNKFCAINQSTAINLDEILSHNKADLTVKMKSTIILDYSEDGYKLYNSQKNHIYWGKAEQYKLFKQYSLAQSYYKQ